MTKMSKVRLFLGKSLQELWEEFEIEFILHDGKKMGTKRLSMKKGQSHMRNVAWNKGLLYTREIQYF